MKYRSLRNRREHLIVPCLLQWLLECVYDKQAKASEAVKYDAAITLYVKTLLEGLYGKSLHNILRTNKGIIDKVIHYFRMNNLKTTHCFLLVIELGKLLHENKFIDLVEDSGFAEAFIHLDKLFNEIAPTEYSNYSEFEEMTLSHANHIFNLLVTLGLYTT